ncbi:hypothetical protein HS041_22480 [Planomonospora sp. ID67723]|uniref:hypothetical protein n=1 Tax=Planomonospora sp. ID67723 TaxID=2738134 RepID=UPI0018C36317|nr:hypothetical protein [Planomonospora sp. ID67723]MBG0830532.1 hypothetical protein [Planomonospora sp. ID67723]
MDVVRLSPGEDLGELLFAVEGRRGGADGEALVVAEEGLGAASGAGVEDRGPGDHFWPR